MREDAVYRPLDTEAKELLTEDLSAILNTIDYLDDYMSGETCSESSDLMRFRDHLLSHRDALESKLSYAAIDRTLKP